MTSRGGRFSEVMTDKRVATHMHGERKKLRKRKRKEEAQDFPGTRVEDQNDREKGD